MTNKDPFEFPPAGKVRFLDVPVIDHIVTGNTKALSTGFKLLDDALRKHPIKSFHITAAVPSKDPSIMHGLQALRMGNAAYHAINSALAAFLTVRYESPHWVARNSLGSFEQVWVARPTRKQVRHAQRALYAQRRLEEQLAEAHDAELRERN